MKGIILAAGKGDRLKPLTDYKPKALLPICNKPLIEYQLELLKRHGIDEIAIVVGYLKEQIDLPDVRWYEDRLIKGTATALYAARDFIDDEFILIYGDLFLDVTNFNELVEAENAMAIVKVHDISRYGEVLYEGARLKAIREKSGSGEGFANAGIYHLAPSILDFAERTPASARGEYELTDAVQMLNENERVTVIPLTGYWNDIGYPWEYLDANQYMLDRLGFAVGEDTEIWPSALIRKPAVIGTGCQVKHSIVERSVVGDHGVVGEFSVLKRSVLMSNAKVPHLNYVADSVIAEGCNLGAGTKIANLRFDDAPIKMSIKGERINSGRRKLGAFIGYQVKTGINVSIYPGVKISSNKWIEAGSLVNRDI